jgi:branched-chain amino acid transport system substrate-binding protein
MTARSHLAPSAPRRRLVPALAGLLCLALVAGAGAAPSGPPIRVGSTLALTGPLAATALIHKIAGEIFLEQVNESGGLLGRPV